MRKRIQVVAVSDDCEVLSIDNDRLYKEFKDQSYFVKLMKKSLEHKISKDTIKGEVPSRKEMYKDVLESKEMKMQVLMNCSLNQPETDEVEATTLPPKVVC